jgi:transposase
VKESIVKKVRRDRYGREKSCADLAGDLSREGVDISATTVWRVLKSAGYNKTKPTRKPGLTKKMKEERLAWCRTHEHWTLDDWKNVIWSDETSVVLNHRRGGYRVWRTRDEAFTKSVIRERWKGYSEFMFWGCFSYDYKGPCHVWKPETAQEKKDAAIKINALNIALEPEMREQWELTTSMRRIGLRNKPGKAPQWRWTEKNGKLTRRGGGGIDWWRYQTQVLMPKLLPFAKQCMEARPGTLVQEDKAPSHAHHAQIAVYSKEGVNRIIWCGNSPDLNAIEPAWPWIKRKTTKKGAPKSRAEAARVWQKAWDDLPQEQIQAWIERIPVHVQKIIELEGGNEYKEGRRPQV